MSQKKFQLGHLASKRQKIEEADKCIRWGREMYRKGGIDSLANKCCNSGYSYSIKEFCRRQSLHLNDTTA